MDSKNKENTKPGDFIVIEEGSHYLLPSFEVKEGVGLTVEGISGTNIRFVRGSKLGAEQVEKRIGITHESLMEMMIHDLKYKNSLVPSRETALTVTKLEEALLWQQRRGQLRAKEGKQGTYKK